MKKFALLTLAVMTMFACTEQGENGKKTSNSNSNLSALLAKMSLEEKVGQMTQINIDVISNGELYNLDEPHSLNSEKLSKALRDYHIGSFLNVGGHAYDLKHWNEIITEIQSWAVDSTENKIPVVYGIDAIHGANYLQEGIMFPQPLAQAASFNPALVERGAAITAYETRASGIPWNFSPVLDLGRQPLWSRHFETYGEDVYLAKRMGSAAIAGYQGQGEIDAYHVAACMKHFLGYSASWTGKDRTPSYIPERQLREYYLPTFKLAIEQGAKTVMINSGEINGVPVHASSEILIDLLRDELGFEGVAVTDWEDIIKLTDNHKIASSLKEAVKISVNAGIDMSMTPNDYRFNDLLIELVNEGEVPMSRIDESVMRVLQLKEDLGLFENPVFGSNAEFPLVGSQEHSDAAYQMAAESITLLKNEGDLLPLDKNTGVGLAGNAADSKIMLNGAWSRTWQGVDENWDGKVEMNTIKDAMMNEFTNLKYVDVDLDSDLNYSAINQLGNAEVLVFCLGETPSTEKPGDIDDLHIKEIYKDWAVALGEKPYQAKVLVLTENRPRLIREIEPLFDAIVLTYQPGSRGADALADVISGDVNPSGKLPFTYPQYPNTLITYDHKYTETLDQQFGNNAFNPQYEFGHGLSYSKFGYADLTISGDTITGEDAEIKISVSVTNHGAKGKESVLMFVTDEFASITPSVKRLRGFNKIELNKDQTESVEFTILPSELAFVNKENEWEVEEGEFTVRIGDLEETFYYKK